MSTEETWEEDYTCPCGKGKIVKSVVSPDHAYARQSCSFSIDCPFCAQAWHITHNGVMRPIALSNESRAASDALHELTRAAYSLRIAMALRLAAAAEPIPPKSKKAEMELMRTKYKEYAGCYSTYCRERQSRNFGEMIAPYFHPQTESAVPADLQTKMEVARTRHLQAMAAVTAAERPHTHWDLKK